LVVRRESLEANPSLRQALTELTGRFTDLTIRKLNYQVDGEHRPVREVAEQFLRDAGLRR
jgi:osmoprotectant transport system substrate-binding protein